MRVIVCGGRYYNDRERLDAVLSYLVPPITVLIQGGGDGAERLAVEWAFDHKIPVATFVADKKAHGEAAGPIRNQRMVDEAKPEALVAFPGTSGTSDLLRRARRVGLRIVEVAE